MHGMVMVMVMHVRTMTLRFGTVVTEMSFALHGQWNHASNFCFFLNYKNWFHININIQHHEMNAAFATQ